MGAYTPELSEIIDNDPNLSDGARRCGRKVSAYVYRRNRDTLEAETTVTWLMEALGKSRRTVQRYLRELERAGYIAVDVLRAGTRWCAGLVVRLLASLLPRHGWPEKLIKPAMPSVSHNYKYRYKTERVPRDIWAVRCMDGVFRSLMKSLPPLPPLS
jgi:DNA-binding transcriptional ArsR family regulator